LQFHLLSNERRKIGVSILNKVEEIFSTAENKDEYGLLSHTIIFDKIHADVSFVNASDELDVSAFKSWREEFKNAEFISENESHFKVKREVEKMSKSKYNVVNPDDIVSCHSRWNSKRSRL
jgi:leucyl-tRNA synthetase